MANKYMKRCSTLTKQRNQNYSVVSPHTSQTSHHQKKPTNNESQTECGEKRNLFYTIGGVEADTETMENSMQVPLKIKNRITIWLSNPTPGHITGENYNSKRYTHPNVHCSTIYNSRTQKQLNCPSAEEWIKRIIFHYIYIIGLGLLSQKKE